VTRTCRSCGRAFETDRSHHAYCWDCYWEERDKGRWDDEDRSSEWRKAPPGWNDQPPRKPPVTLDPRLLRDAIALTHPDRHPPERARTANAVTAALLELLNQQRKAG
jgi:hypothetical protein